MSVDKVLRVIEQKEQPEPNRYERNDSCGSWDYADDGVTIVWRKVTKKMNYDIVLREWIVTETKTEDFSPENSPFKCAKELIADVVIIREKDDDESITGKTILTYLRRYKIAVRNEFPNVWLTIGDSDNRVYVKDLFRMYTYRFDLMTDERVLCKKISEKRITTEEAKTVKTGYIFSKIEKIDENTELLGTYVKPRS